MIGTSPPKQKSVASVTLSARIVPTAASAALPPPRRTVSPASTASCPPAATAPCLPLACQTPVLASCATTRHGSSNAVTLPRRTQIDDRDFILGFQIEACFHQLNS